MASSSKKKRREPNYRELYRELKKRHRRLVLEVDGLITAYEDVLSDTYGKLHRMHTEYEKLEKEYDDLQVESNEAFTKVARMVSVDDVVNAAWNRRRQEKPS